MKKSSPLRLAALGLLLAVIVAVVISFAFFKEELHLTERLGASLEAVRELGPWGPVALAAVYILACVFFVPGSLLTLAAGVSLWRRPGNHCRFRRQHLRRRRGLSRRSFPGPRLDRSPRR